MIAFDTLSVDGNTVQYAYFNGHKCYSALYDYAQTAIDEMSDVLDNAQNVGTDTKGGVTFNVWQTIKNGDFCHNGAGNTNPWIVSKHLMASAKHYGAKPTGSYTLANGDVIQRLEWFNLRDWALEHGGVEKYGEEIMTNDCADVDLCKIEGAVPDSYCPWFINPQMCRKIFWNDITYNIVGYRTSQYYDYGIPVLLKFAHGKQSICGWTDLYNNDECPTELSRRVHEMGVECPVLVGDSGKPIYMSINGKQIVVGQFHQTVNGPCFVSLYDVMKDCIESFGDTMREFEI